MARTKCVYNKMKEEGKVRNGKFATAFEQGKMETKVFEDFTTLELRGTGYDLHVTISGGKIQGKGLIILDESENTQVAGFQISAEDIARMMLAGVQ